MQINEIKELMNEFSKSDLTSFEYSEDGKHISFKKEVSMPQMPMNMPFMLNGGMDFSNMAGRGFDSSVKELIASVGSSEINHEEEIANLAKIKAPVVGVYYAQSSPENPPFVEVGKKIKKGDVVGVIEAMKMFMDIKSDVSGIVRKIHAKSGDVLSFNDVIMEIEEQN